MSQRVNNGVRGCAIQRTVVAALASLDCYDFSSNKNVNWMPLYSEMIKKDTELT